MSEVIAVRETDPGMYQSTSLLDLGLGFVFYATKHSANFCERKPNVPFLGTHRTAFHINTKYAFID